jgi:hypothetical protein
MIHLMKTHSSTLPWRLFADELDGRRLHIPHASCDTKREALRLKERLEGVADWGSRELWDWATYAAVRDVLSTTESARVQAEALAQRQY